MYVYACGLSLVVELYACGLSTVCECVWFIPCRCMRVVYPLYVYACGLSPVGVCVWFIHCMFMRVTLLSQICEIDFFKYLRASGSSMVSKTTSR